jgi:serine/threonine-protein kinase
MLTGRVPFEGESPVTIALKQVNEAPVPPSHYNAAVPAALEDAVLRALAKEPSERFGDADAFIAALEEARAQIAAGTAAPASPPTTAFTAVAPAPVVAEQEVVVEREAEPEPERSRAGWLWALLVGLLVAGAVVAGLLLLGEDQVSVPQVVGIEGDAAKIKLEERGLQIDIDLQPNDAPEGVVFSQRPVAGTKVDEGSVVSVLVSSGPGDAQIPNVEGLGRRDATKALTKAGFEVEVKTEPDSEVEKGFAIRTLPTAGSELEIGSVVDLYVSEGPPDVEVPNVVGDPLDDARSALRDAGFEVEVTEQENPDEEPNTVIAQDPAAGGDAPEGSTVTLTVAVEPSQVEVPDVEGEQQSDAFRILQDAGFRVQPEEQDTEVLEEDGVVLAQDPEGKTKAEPGDTITIVVGRFNPDLNPDGAGTETTPEASPPVEGAR